MLLTGTRWSAIKGKMSVFGMEREKEKERTRERDGRDRWRDGLL